METKKLKSKSILCLTIFAFAVGMTWLATSVINTAFGSEDEASTTVEEQQNANLEISFNMDGVERGVAASIILVEGKSRKYDYNLGDKLNVEEGSVVTYGDVLSNTATITIKSSSGVLEYSFQIYTPFGYDFSKYTPETAPSSLTENTDFKVVYKKSLMPYTVKGTVIKTGRGQTPVSGATVKLFKKDQSSPITTTSDAEGKYSFENVPIDHLDGLLFAEGEDLTDYFVLLDPSLYSPTHVCDHIIKLSDKNEAELQINKPSEHHKYFEIRTLQILKPDTILSDESVRKESLFLDMEVPVSGDWVIEMNGTLTYKIEVYEYINLIQIVPYAEEGYSLSEWLQYKDNNEVLHFKPGETITLGNEPLKVEPVYSGSSPEPTPTPGEDVNATPQTGDSSPLVPFALLAVLAAGALLYNRKDSYR